MDQANATKAIKGKSYREMNPEELAAALEENKKIFDSEFDSEYMRGLNSEIVEMLNWYFRPEFVGFDEMPQRNNPDHPIIFACNHSGMAFPWDAIIFGAGLFDKHKYELNKLFRALAAPMLSASDLMNPFLLTDLWKRVGAVDATGLNFETMMHYMDSNLLIYPEGVPGIGKGFNRKYQLQTFSTSMIRMSIKYKTDIHGVSCVNGEYINPFSYTSRRLNRFVNKAGLPYLPVALQTPLLLIQPWLFYYALPAKLTYVLGKKYSPYEMVGNRPLEEVSKEEISAIRDHIQSEMQKDLDQGVKDYGQKPYNWGEFLQSIRKHWWDLPYWTPIGWPALFTEFDRRYQKGEKKPKGIIRGWFRFWRIAFKNPIVFAYYIPILGWIPILIKGMKGRRAVEAWEGSKN
ncbi:MAG: hypothetical protein MRZ79_09535 [Bacteroidia bacterium]|nr:hypothetical protein [Bacteroidia bacterium]